MEQYLMDTNAVSDYFSASLSSSGMKFMDSVVNAIPNLSVITQIELLSWRTDEATAQNVIDFVNDSVILDVSPNVVIRCVELRKNKKVKTPDAIIAATALVKGYTLITNNEKDFVGILNLKIINPHKI